MDRCCQRQHETGGCYSNNRFHGLPPLRLTQGEYKQHQSCVSHYRPSRHLSSTLAASPVLSSSITSHWPLARAGCPVGWLPSVPLPANSVSPRGREFPLLLDASPVLEVRFWLSTYSPRFRRSQTLLAKFLQDGFAQQFGIVFTGFCERDNSLGNHFRGESLRLPASCSDPAPPEPSSIKPAECIERDRLGRARR